MIMPRYIYVYDAFTDFERLMIAPLEPTWSFCAGADINEKQTTPRCGAAMQFRSPSDFAHSPPFVFVTPVFCEINVGKGHL